MRTRGSSPDAHLGRARHKALTQEAAPGMQPEGRDSPVAHSAPTGEITPS
jgi:hypothetical protein